MINFWQKPLPPIPNKEIFKEFHYLFVSMTMDTIVELLDTSGLFVTGVMNIDISIQLLVKIQ